MQHCMRRPLATRSHWNPGSLPKNSQLLYAAAWHCPGQLLARRLHWHPSGAKARIDFAPLAARPKSRPDSKGYARFDFQPAVKSCPDSRQFIRPAPGLDCLLRRCQFCAHGIGLIGVDPAAKTGPGKGFGARTAVTLLSSSCASVQPAHAENSLGLCFQSLLP